MPFTLEDGTGITDANAYIDIAFADAYFADRRNFTWAGKDADKEAHIIIASDYADRRWGSKMLGIPLVEEQGMEIPRNKAYDRYGRALAGVPTKWKQAIAEYALASLKGELYPKVSATTSKEVKKKKTTVGPITTEVEYEGANTADAPLSFPEADKLAKVMVSSGARVMR